MASKAAAMPDYIATLEPLIIQMYFPSTENIIDLETVTATTVPRLLTGHDRIGLIYLEEQINQTDADKARYKQQMQFFDALP
jgi:hypothetical protein